MYNMPEFSKDLCAALVSCGSGAARVVDAARRLSGERYFVLAIKPLDGIEKRLVPAYMGAAIRHKEGTMRSNSLAMETLLFVSGTMNIGNAIEHTAADGPEFILFSNKTRLVNQLVSKFALKVIKRYDLGLDFKASGGVAIASIKDDK